MSKKRIGGKEPYARTYASAAQHPRIVAAGLAATGLWTRAKAYCADYQTDGFVPTDWLKGIDDGKALKAAVAAGLIEGIDNGYIVRHYLDHNRSKAQVEERRGKERGKKAGLPRGNGSGKNEGTPGGTVVPLSGERSGDSSRLSYSVEQQRAQT